MAQLPLDEAVDRFQQNEERVDKFVNDGSGYTTSGGVVVESLPAFLDRVETEIEQTTGTVASNLAASQAARAGAEAARAGAEAARAGAGAARDAAVAGAPGVYATTAAGLAVVAVNGYFSVPSSDSNETYILYRVDAGPIATEIKRYPSAALLSWTNEYRRTAGSSALTEKVVEPSGNLSNSVYRGLTVTAGDVIDVWLTAKAAGRHIVNLFNNGGATMDVRIDLELGTAVDVSISTDSREITPLGNGWYLVHVVKTVAASGTGNLQFRLYGPGSASAPFGGATYSGNGSSGAYVDSILVYNRTTSTYPFPSARLSAASWTKLNSTVVAATVTNEDTLGAQVLKLKKVTDEYQLGLGFSYPTNKITESSGSVSPSLYASFAFVVSGIYSLTVVAKAAGRNKLNFYSNAGALFNATFDFQTELSTGLSGGQTLTFKRLGNGWYEVVLTVTATQSANSNIQLRMADDSGNTTYTGNGSSGLYIDSIRLSSSSTNSHLQSTDPKQEIWSKQNISVVEEVSTNFANGGVLLANLIRVFGELTADKFVEAAGASVSPSVYRSYAFNSGTSYTFGGDFKAGERHRVNLYCNGGALFNAIFNLRDGVVESGSGATISSLGNGWYRCQQTVVASGSTTANLQIRTYPDAGGHPYAGNGSSGIYANDAYLNTEGPNLLSNSSNFATAWNLQNVSVQSEVAFFGGTGSGGGIPDSYVDPGAQAWVGKKLAVIGTSITEQAQYTVPLASELNCTLTNLGTSGGSLASGSHYGSLYIYNAISSIPTDSQVVLVEAGTNDFGTDNSTLGSLGDTTTSTFYGAIFAACVAIRSRAPNAKIIFLTPYSGDSRASTYSILRTNTKGHTLDQFQKAVEEGAGYCGYAVVDVGRQSGIGYHTGTIYLGDGLHLNATGGLRFSNFVAEGLRSLARGGYLD